MYLMLDDQSNECVIHGNASPYKIKTCSGTTETTGRRASGFVVESVNGGVPLLLPTLTEYNLILGNRDDIPTPEAASYHPHLKMVAAEIPPLDPSAEILLLLGRYIIHVHKVCSQCNGPHNAPFAQRLDLGWVIVGDVCLRVAEQANFEHFQDQHPGKRTPQHLPSMRE